MNSDSPTLEVVEDLVGASHRYVSAAAAR